jgi:hypothetical protein
LSWPILSGWNFNWCLWKFKSKWFVT